jgi:VCBS repeat-containing protein
MRIVLPLPKNRLQLHSQTAVLTLFAAGLSACGGGGDITAVGSSTQDVILTKGPLQGAEAFIDADGDGVWTEGVDSAKATSDADGKVSIANPNNLQGDIVAITNANTIDAVSGEILDGLTLFAPSGYEIVSPATTVAASILNDPANASLTDDEVQTQVKSALGLDASVDLSTFNPFDETADAGIALAYEKSAFQIVSIANALSEVETAGGSSKADALSNALSAVVDVVVAAGSDPVDLSSATTIDSVVTELTASSAVFAAQASGDAAAALDSLKVAIAVVNSAIDDISDITDTSGFAKAQVALENIAAEAAIGRVSTVTSLDDFTALLTISGDDAVSLVEGAASLSVSGQLTATDPDTSDSVTYSFSETASFLSGTGADGSAMSAAIGTFTVAADGSYTFTVDETAIDYLDDGDTVVQVFEVVANASDDSNSGSKFVTVTLEGSNDAPVLTAADRSLAPTSVSGSFSATDVDAGDTSFTFSASSSANESLVGSYGTMVLDASTGSYTYTVDAENADVVGLESGANLTDSFTISVSDGTTRVSETMDFTIKGSDVGSALKGPLSGALVFYDYNGDGVLSVGEPFTQTAADGSYEISSVTGLDLASLPEGYDDGFDREDFSLVVAMDEDTVDSTSGESYSDTGVTMKAASGGSVITPMTTLHEHSEQHLTTAEDANADAGAGADAGADAGGDAVGDLLPENVIALFADDYEEVPVTTWSTGWDDTSEPVDEVDADGNTVKTYQAINFAGIEMPAVDASGMTHFTIDVYTPDATAIEIKLVDTTDDNYLNWTDGITVINADSATPLVQNEWVTIDIELAGLELPQLSSIGQIVISVMEESGTTRTLKIDNVGFINETASEVAGEGASEVAYEAADVIALFAGDYEEVPVTTWSTGWDDTTDPVDSVNSDGDNVKTYQAINFAGIEMPAIDASGMTHFVLDVLSPDATAIEIKLVDTTDDNYLNWTDGIAVFNADSTPAFVPGESASLEIELASLNLPQLTSIGQVVISVMEEAGTTRTLEIYGAGFVNKGVDAEADSASASPAGVTSFSAAELAEAVGLPDGIDILNYNTHDTTAAGYDVEIAHEVETIAQHLMTTKQLVAAAIRGAGTPETGVAVSDEIAYEASLDSLIKLILKAHSEGETGGIAGELDLTVPAHLLELEAFIEADLATGDLADTLTASGASVPAAVLEYVLEHSSAAITNVAAAFDELSHEDFGGILAGATSAVKHDAAEEIYNLGVEARAYYDANAAGFADGSVTFETSSDVVFTNLSTTWDESADPVVEVMDGDTVLAYNAINYAGIEMEAVDASSMTHLHLEVWTPDASALEIKLVDTTDENYLNWASGVSVFNADSTPAITTGEWVSIDIELAELGLPTLSSIGQMIVSVMEESGTTKTLKLDNVYFYESVEGGDASAATNVIRLFGEGLVPSEAVDLNTAEGVAAQIEANKAAVTAYFESQGAVPTLNALSAGSVTEDGDALTGTATGTVSGLGVSEGDTPTFVLGGTSTLADGVYTAAGTYGSLTLDSASGAYTYTLNNSDAAVQGLGLGDVKTETFSVQSTTADYSSQVETLTVTVNGANDPVVISSGTTASVNEGTAIDTVVYQAAATDADTADTVSYSVSNTANFAIDADTGAVTLKAVSDYDTATSYDFTVTASAGSSSSTVDVTLEVVPLPAIEFFVLETTNDGSDYTTTVSLDFAKLVEAYPEADGTGLSGYVVNFSPTQTWETIIGIEEGNVGEWTHNIEGGSLAKTEVVDVTKDTTVNATVLDVGGNDVQAGDTMLLGTLTYTIADGVDDFDLEVSGSYITSYDPQVRFDQENYTVDII